MADGDCAYLFVQVKFVVAAVIPDESESVKIHIGRNDYIVSVLINGMEEEVENIDIALKGVSQREPSPTSLPLLLLLLLLLPLLLLRLPIADFVDLFVLFRWTKRSEALLRKRNMMRRRTKK